MAARIYKNASGRRVPSVTTILAQNGWNKRPLMIWAHRLGLDGKSMDEAREAAADAGTCAHDLIECWIRKTTPDLSKYPTDILSKAMQCYENFISWQRKMAFEPLYPELELVSEDHQYGGCLDLVARIDGKICLFDWKSSEGVYPDYLMQAIAYKHLWDENASAMKGMGLESLGKMKGGIYLLQIRKESAAWANHWWEDCPPAWEAFMLLRRLYELKPVIERAA